MIPDVVDLPPFLLRVKRNGRKEDFKNYQALIVDADNKLDLGVIFLDNDQQRIIFEFFDGRVFIFNLKSGEATIGRSRRDIKFYG